MLTKEKIKRLFKELNEDCIFTFLCDTYTIPEKDNIQHIISGIDQPMILTDDLYRFDMMNIDMMAEMRCRDVSACVGLVSVKLPDGLIHLAGFYINDGDMIIYIETVLNHIVYELEYTPLSVIV